MDKLAPEIIQEILGHIRAKSDLASLRLVQRSFGELGAEYIFRVINIKTSFLGVEPLLTISRHAKFSKYVKEVVMHLGDYRDSIWLPFLRELKSKGLENGTVTEKKGLLERLEGEYWQFQRSADYTGVLSTAFMQLPRLEAIRVNEQRERGVDPLTAREMVEHAMREDYEQHEDSDDEDYDQHDWGSGDGYRAFSALVGAAYFGGVKLVSFRSNAAMATAHGRHRELAPRAAVVFKECPVLELALPQCDAGLLCELLKPAVRLERLKLQFDLEDYPKSACVFSKIVESGCVWASLKEVAVRTVSASGNVEEVVVVGL